MRRPGVYIALLRGINVAGHKIIPMSDLRALAAEIGWDHVQTHIQSGNVVFAASGPVLVLETQLEQAIERQFHLSVPVIVRAAADWSHYAGSNPFPEAVKNDPNHVLLALSKAPPRPGTASALQERADGGERVVQAGDALWIHFAGGIGRSKLSPAVLDRITGSPVTARNWTTVLKLRDLAERVGI